jgi:hypothetical protein
LKTKIFYPTLKNALAYNNAGVVAENSKVVGLAPMPVLVFLRGALKYFLVSFGYRHKGMYHIT